MTILGRTADGHESLDAWRAVMRDGRADAGALPPVVRTSQEGEVVKFILRRPDGLETESVIIPNVGSSGRVRRTLCLSSQVGCAMGCDFCETAQMGLMANLSAAEIVAQWWTARFVLDTPIDNIVFMGMGEPMDNPDAVLQAIRVLIDHHGPAIPVSRISVSTVGRVKGIRQLAAFASTPGRSRLQLAVSINAPNDEIRSSIMPINRGEPMATLMEAMLAWSAAARSRLLIEYVLIPGVNDGPDHPAELAAYLSPLDCTVNVIPYNPRRDSPWPAPAEGDVQRFVDAVAATGLPVRRRQTKGRGLMAACGQLGNPSIRRRRFVELGTPRESGSSNPAHT